MEWELVTLRSAVLGCWPQQLDKQAATRAIKAGEVERAVPATADRGCGASRQSGPIGPPNSGQGLKWSTERHPGKTEGCGGPLQT